MFAKLLIPVAVILTGLPALAQPAKVFAAEVDPDPILVRSSVSITDLTFRLFSDTGQELPFAVGVPGRVTLFMPDGSSMDARTEPPPLTATAPTTIRDPQGHAEVRLAPGVLTVSTLLRQSDLALATTPGSATVHVQAGFSAQGGWITLPPRTRLVIEGQAVFESETDLSPLVALLRQSGQDAPYSIFQADSSAFPSITIASQYLPVEGHYAQTSQMATAAGTMPWSQMVGPSYMRNEASLSMVVSNWLDRPQNREFYFSVQSSSEIRAVPEPDIGWLMLCGASVLALVRRRARPSR